MTVDGSAPDLERIGVKVFCADGSSVPLVEFIPIFHRWIQRRALDGTLIDVADYSHVARGPGILLVAHEGIYSIDEGGGRRGLAYSLRHASGGTLGERLAGVTRAALAACAALAAEPELAGRIGFRGDELALFANDRLLAPNTEATLAAVRGDVRALLARLYPGADCAVTRAPDPGERFALAVKAPGPVSVATLLDRLGA